jgi:hypothetical protein
MNNIYSGSFTKRGLIYDYSGIWTPLPAGVAWKAIVRNAAVVCRPSGRLYGPCTHTEILEIIRQRIESSVMEAIDRRLRIA